MDTVRCVLRVKSLDLENVMRREWGGDSDIPMKVWCSVEVQRSIPASGRTQMDAMMTTTWPLYRRIDPEAGASHLGRPAQGSNMLLGPC